MVINWSSPLLHKLRWLPIILGTVWLAFGWIQIILRLRGDFHHHWESGRRILAGEYLYKGGLNFVYPPFWALAHAPLALLDKHVAQIIAYILVPAALAVLLWTLHQLSKFSLPLDSDRLFWSTVLAIFLAVNFLTRDFPEVGINTALVALSWFAIYLWTQKRDIEGGISLGLAAALKCTPLLFVAYFALKRQWKMVATSTVAFALFTVSPVVVQGPDQYAHAMTAWIGSVMQGITDPDPSRGPLGQDKVENLALRPALARYLMRLPYGHLGRPETSDTPGRPNQPPNPFYLQFANLSPYWAGVVVRIIMVGPLLFVVWSFKNRIVFRGDLSVLYECAAVSLLILLYSPITWKHHCVGVLPALYLICRASFAGLSLPRWSTGALATYALFSVVLSRVIVGKDMVKLLDSYHVKTMAIVVLTVAVSAYRQTWLSMEKERPSKQGWRKLAGM